MNLIDFEKKSNKTIEDMLNFENIRYVIEKIFHVLRNEHISAYIKHVLVHVKFILYVTSFIYYTYS